MKTLKAISLVCLCLLTGGFIASGAPAAKSANSATTPLTFANAVSFFKAAKFRATEVQPRCVIFYLTDAHEMNWVTEFLDSPFFNRTETEKLFRLLNSGTDVRGQNMGRFRVDFHHWQPRHAQILVFSFTPVRGRG
jgi:hypothetical protein